MIGVMITNYSGEVRYGACVHTWLFWRIEFHEKRYLMSRLFHWQSAWCWWLEQMSWQKVFQVILQTSGLTEGLRLVWQIGTNRKHPLLSSRRCVRRANNNLLDRRMIYHVADIRYQYEKWLKWWKDKKIGFVPKVEEEKNKKKRSETHFAGNKLLHISWTETPDWTL